MRLILSLILFAACNSDATIDKISNKIPTVAITSHEDGSTFLEGVTAQFVHRLLTMTILEIRLPLPGMSTTTLPVRRRLLRLMVAHFATLLLAPTHSVWWSM